LKRIRRETKVRLYLQNVGKVWNGVIAKPAVVKLVKELFMFYGIEE
jgi:hypothetical protein